MRHPSQSSGLRFPSDLDLCLPCPPVNLSTCQLVLPSGQLANRSTDQLIAPSSVIHSALPHFGWQVAAPGGRWRVFRPASSTQSSVIRHRCSHPFQVAGGSPGRPVAGVPPSVIDSAIRHLSSMQSSISGGRWQPRVAGGGAFPFSPPLSPQRSPPFSPP